SKWAAPSNSLEAIQSKVLQFGFSCLPDGYVRHTIGVVHSETLDLFIAPHGIPSSRLDLKQLRNCDRAIDQGWKSPHSIWNEEFLGMITHYGHRIYYVHHLQEFARVAIALERFYLANGAYPKLLDELIPDFLPEIPIDCYDPPNPIRYELTPNGRYKLWSLGDNGIPEGGHPGSSNGYTDGDVVWQYAKPPSTAP
ncbi:MAG: hypothetical protein AAF585_21830, partial [Verrucomicrobiota bacterium]